ncbi:MAG: hypothetical protein KF708_02310 [Pirellulales bacterium]|nr:hypothetical protein [Pirellulales bacterium]
MHVTSRLGCLTLVGFMVLVIEPPTHIARAEQKESEAGGEAKRPVLLTRVYPVADLVFTPRNYPFPGIEISGTRARGGVGFGGMGSSTGNGGGGGFGGGMGGGMPSGGGQFNVQDDRASLLIDDLMNVITSYVEPQSWDQVGSDGHISIFREQLIVVQTAAIHEQIAALLSDLRKQGMRDTITVRAQWAVLDGEQFAALTEGAPDTSPPQIDRAKLKALSTEASTAPRPATSAIVDAGEVTCFNGQTVHIVSGRFRSAVTSVIPVVGQLEGALPVESAIAHAVVDSPTAIAASEQVRIDELVLAQVAEVEKSEAPVSGPSPPNSLQTATLNQHVGYQPIVSTQHSGIMFEVTPITMPGQDAVVLDLRSIVSQWQPAATGAVSFGGITHLDQSEVVSQQLATTIRVPLGQPVVAGGLTLEPGTPNASGPRLYLIVEAVAGAGAK